MKKQSEVSIEFAKDEDKQGILEIQKLFLIETSDKTEDYLQNKGFLVNEIDSDDLQEAAEHNQSESFLMVAKNSEGKVIGYFLAYDMDYFLSKYPNWRKDTGVEEDFLNKNKILYGRHLASDGSIPRVGKKLNKKLFQFAKEKGYTHYLGEICEGPVSNDKSLAIHKNIFSMKKIATYQDENGYEWGIYVKEL